MSEVNISTSELSPQPIPPVKLPNNILLQRSGLDSNSKIQFNRWIFGEVNKSSRLVARDYSVFVQIRSQPAIHLAKAEMWETEMDWICAINLGILKTVS